MVFNSVYQTLFDLFPQVDTRLLKAVAIEHARDPDKAVETILTEVLPFTSVKSNVATPIVSNNGKMAEEPSSSFPNLGSVSGVDTTDPRPLNEALNVDDDSLASSFYDANDTDDLQKLNSRDEEVISYKVCKETVVDSNEAEKLVVTAESLILECSKDDCSHVAGNHEGETSVPSHDDQKLKRETDVHVNVIDGASSATINVDCGKANVSLVQHCNVDYECIKDSPSFDYDAQQLSQDFHLLGNRSSADEASISAREPEAGSGTNFSDADNKENSNDVGADFIQDFLVTDAGAANGDTTLGTIVTNSGQICRINLLEEIIEDAKNYKDALFSATESVLKLIEDVEQKEKEAEQAKAAAARGGLDIVEKVEEMKKMLEHAKEANEMHAGEVYGERSILATEVRELQTRLLGLADEKDKSLSMLEEMRKTLEARLAATDEERIAAEKEMLEKRDIARAALVEQELIMEKVVQESKLLQQEAEENAKLRDFLMEKGQVVDELQGEISVFCQDVKTLKEKFDKRLSLSQSLSLEQTSFRQASSSSSVKSHSSVMSMASDPAAGNLESLETPRVPSRAPSSAECLTPRSNVGEEADATPRKEPFDDDWELFDF